MDRDELNEILGVENNQDDSRSGDIYATESGVGTAKTVPEQDTSASNLYND